MNTKNMSILKNIMIMVVIPVFCVFFLNTAYCSQDAEQKKTDQNAVTYEDNPEEQFGGTTREIQDDGKGEISYYEKIAKAHPDYQEIAQDPRFAEYIDNMPLNQLERAERIIESGTADEVIKLLSDYKMEFLGIKTINTIAREMYIEDRANIVDEETEERLNNYLGVLESKTGTLMTVLTLETTDGKPAKQFLYDVVDKREDSQLVKSNGIYIVIASNDRKYSIKVGTDLKEALSNDFCAGIGKDLFVPNFKTGNYSQGIYEGTVAIINELAQK